MTRAAEEQRWIVATDLPQQPQLPRRCEQMRPRQGLCERRVDHVCDGCGKLVCRSCCLRATAPRSIERDLDAALAAGALPLWLRCGETGRPIPPRQRIDPAAPELCITCKLIEEHYGISFEEIDADQRAAYCRSAAAIGYVSLDQVDPPATGRFTRDERKD